jgi:Spatacsin C-terminus
LTTFNSVNAVIVELLIRSHDCYTAACDMEGIADVLLRARSITANLLQQQEWQLMVGVRKFKLDVIGMDSQIYFPGPSRNWNWALQRHDLHFQNPQRPRTV